MDFEYFAGPANEMSQRCDKACVCSLCGQIGVCFKLDCAICPELASDRREASVGCLSCLRQGRFEFWHDTEIGVLDAHGLRTEYKHNKPAPKGFPPPRLVALRRTPQIVTWQQELWLVHCDDFMVYRGTWDPADFYANASDGDGRALFLRMTDSDLSHLWDESLREGASRLDRWYATYYVFRCRHCGTMRGNWDCG